MSAGVRRAVRRWRDSLWFLPFVLMLGAAVLAETLIALERHGALPSAATWGVVIGAEGARGVLAAIATTALTVATTAFSITISVIATASATYGPRLVRNFMSDRRNQWVLGVFVATFLYSLLVLRSISAGGDQEPFVPQLAVDVAVGAALACVVALVYFIHHVASSIQVATMANAVRTTFVEVVEQQWSGRHAEPAPDAREGDGKPVPSPRSGYVTVRDTAALVGLAERRGVEIDLAVAVGDYVVAGEPLARVHGSLGVDDDLAEAVALALNLGPVRTATQDVRFALRQVLDLSIRALSPGTNDPFTAVQAVDEISGGLVRMVSSGHERTYAPEDGRPLVRWAPTDRAAIVAQAFTELLPYTTSHPVVLAALVRLAARVRDAARDDACRDAAVLGMAELTQRFEASDPVPRVREELDTHLLAHGFAPLSPVRG